MKGLALVALALVAGLAPAGAAAAEVPPIGVIDLTTQPTAALALRDALAGAHLPLAKDGLFGGVVVSASPDQLVALGALAEAQAAYAAHTCDAALLAVDRALDALLTVREAVARPPRVSARALALLCADQLGDGKRAHLEARALAALHAGTPPPGVPDAVWGRWADVEVDVLLGSELEPRGQLRVESSEPDTVILLDGRELGPAPVEVEVTGGSHAVVGLAPGHDPARLLLDLGAKPPRSQTALVKPRPSPEAAARDAVRASLTASAGKFELGAVLALARRVKYARAVVMATDGVRLVSIPEGLAGPRRELPGALPDLIEEARLAVSVPAPNPTLGRSARLDELMSHPAPAKKHGSKLWPWVAAGTVVAVTLTIMLVRPGSGGADTLTIHTQYP